MILYPGDNNVYNNLKKISKGKWNETIKKLQPKMKLFLNP